MITKNYNKTILVSMMLIIMAALVLAACSSAKPATDTAATSIPPIISSTGVIVEGKVVPAQYAQISFNKSGNVAEVLVKEGDKVTEGQVIARLENSEVLVAEAARAEDALLQAQQALDDLKENWAVEKALKFKDVANATDALRAADRQDYYFTVPEYLSKLDMFAAFELTRTNLEKARKDWDPYKYEEDEWTWKWANTPRDDKKTALDDAEGDFRTSMLRIIYAADKATADENLAKARADYEKLQDGPDADELALAESKVKNAQASLDAAKAALQDLELIAPFDGTIAKIDLKVGEIATTGQPGVTMVDFSEWMVETDDLTEIEVVQIKLGQETTIVPDAIPDAKISGVVDTISDVFEEKRGDVTYTVKIILKEPPAQLRWGMTVAVTFSK